VVISSVLPQIRFRSVQAVQLRSEDLRVTNKILLDTDNWHQVLQCRVLRCTCRQTRSFTRIRPNQIHHCTFYSISAVMR